MTEGQRMVADTVFQRVAASIARVYWPGDEAGHHTTQAFFVGEGVFLSVRPEAALSDEVNLRTVAGNREARV
ncbi:MAG: hypothetical protein ABL994_19245, partial [Verrucomicrobiales bacterium]